MPKTQPPQKVVLLANETKENINIEFAIADAVINGTVQDAGGNILSDLLPGPKRAMLTKQIPVAA